MVARLLGILAGVALVFAAAGCSQPGASEESTTTKVGDDVPDDGQEGTDVLEQGAGTDGGTGPSANREATIRVWGTRSHGDPLTVTYTAQSDAPGTWRWDLDGDGEMDRETSEKTDTDSFPITYSRSALYNVTVVLVGEGVSGTGSLQVPLTVPARTDLMEPIEVSFDHLLGEEPLRSAVAQACPPDSSADTYGWSAFDALYWNQTVHGDNPQVAVAVSNVYAWGVHFYDERCDLLASDFMTNAMTAVEVVAPVGTTAVGIWAGPGVGPGTYVLSGPASCMDCVFGQPT